MFIIDWIGKLIVTVGIDKLVGLFGKLIDDWKAQQLAKAEAAAAQKEMDNAKTADEIDKASSDTLNHL